MEAAVDNAAEEPAYLSGSYTPAASITLKALYRYTMTLDAGYQLVTEAPEDWTGSYIITYGKEADSLFVLKGLNGTKKYESRTAGGAVSFADTGMTLEDFVLDHADSAYVFRVTSADGKLVIRNDGTGSYLASKGGYLYSYKTNAAAYCRWTLTAENGAADAVNTAGRKLTHLSFSSGQYFMMDRTAAADLCFWKLQESGSAVVYTTESP